MLLIYLSLHLLSKVHFLKISLIIFCGYLEENKEKRVNIDLDMKRNPPIYIKLQSINTNKILIIFSILFSIFPFSFSPSHNNLYKWCLSPLRVVIGRSNIRSVADSRKMEINNFLRYLWTKAVEISQVQGCAARESVYLLYLGQKQNNCLFRLIQPTWAICPDLKHVFFYFPPKIYLSY